MNMHPSVITAPLYQSRSRLSNAVMQVLWDAVGEGENNRMSLFGLFHLPSFSYWLLLRLSQLYTFHLHIATGAIYRMVFGFFMIHRNKSKVFHQYITMNETWFPI